MPAQQPSPHSDYSLLQAGGVVVAGKCTVLSQGVACGTEIAVKQSNTSSMRKHLKSSHPAVYTEMSRKEAGEKAKRPKTPREQKKELCQSKMGQYLTASGATAATPWKPTDARTKAANRALLQYIARDMRPLSVVENPGFWGLVAHLQPCYPLPSRPTVRAMIEPEAANLRSKIKEELASAMFVSFTTDIWTDMTTNLSYISLTVSVFKKGFKIN